MPIPAIIAGVGGKALDVVGGLFGGGGNTDPAARALADRAAGNIIRLGAPPVALRVPGATDAAPVPGTYYLDKRDGAVYESKKDGLHVVTAGWAVQRTSAWQSARLGLSPQAALSSAGGGMGIGLLALAVGAGALIYLVGRRR